MQSDVSILKNKRQLKSYLSINEYLIDYYESKKAIDEKFSYEIWATQLNFKSKSSLRMMCIGRRNISDKFIDSFIKEENLSESDSGYFLLLAKLQSAKTAGLKKIYLEKIAELTDISFKKIEIKNASDFLSSPVMVIVQMLTAFTDFNATESSLKKITGLESQKIKTALIKLCELDLIESYSTEVSSEICYRTKAKYFSVSSQLQKEATNIFHLATLKEVEKIIQQDIFDKRIKSLYFSMSKKEYSEFTEMVNQFVNKLKIQYGNEQLKNKKLYKINLQAYPVTDTLE